MVDSQDRQEQDGRPAEAASVQVDLYRRMPAGRKLELVFNTYRTGQSLAMAGIRMRHPQAAEGDLWWLWAREHLGEELFETVYGGTDE
jgi:hypothetical protein